MVVSVKAILNVCPTADTNLMKLDAKISQRFKSVWAKIGSEENMDTEGALSTREKKRLQDSVEFNRARIKQARMTAAQNLQDVDNIYKKIKAAMLW